MIIPQYEEAKKYEQSYTYIPVCKEIFADEMTPIQMLKRLANLDEQFFLLESVEGGSIGRYSFLGYHPKMFVTCNNGVVKVKENGMVRIIPGTPVTQGGKSSTFYRRSGWLFCI